MSSETAVALLSYNIGIQHGEITGKAWATRGGKLGKLLSDVQRIFNHGQRIQIALISEMGNMFEKLPDPIIEHIFNGIIKNLKMPNIQVNANAPYVELIDTH